MARSPLYEEGFRPQFAGHETFPLRYGWLKKVFDAVESTAPEANNKGIFLAEDAIGRFGVGKNMVTSMRYWALAARIIVDESVNFKGPFRTTAEGRALLAANGWDPYLEDPASLWWLHLQFATSPRPTTTAYFVFNHYYASSFYRNQLLTEIQRYCEQIGFKDLATFTLKRDIDCFIRTYSARGGDSEEESLESLMSELALIQPIGKRDGFLVARGPKPSLPDAIFLYALIRFAQTRNGARSFTVESLAHDPGSPGRAFLLDEDALLERLNGIEEFSRGAVTWSETAGVRQVFFQRDPRELELLSVLQSAYRPGSHRRRAA